MSSDELFSREELLGGLTGGQTKRAATILFAIEGRTAYLLAQSRQAMDRYLSEASAHEDESVYLDALALGRSRSARISPWNLERFAPKWAALVPDNPRIKAALAHMAGRRFRFTESGAPRIRQTLGLDDPEVREAYEELYSTSADEVFTPRLKPLERLAWSLMRVGDFVDELSPFWTVFALTLTETVGAGILALPIALGGIGPLAGLGLILLVGLLNMVTMVAMAEAVSRYGDIRYGRGYVGRMTQNFLGNTAAGVLSVAMMTGSFIALTAFFIGFSTTLAAATSLPAPLFVALLFAVGVYFLKSKSLNATVASALVVGAVNIGLILCLSLLALTRLNPENLAYVHLPFSGGAFDPSVLALVFGVVLLAFNGHMSVSNCARVVIHRDPSCRSLILGSLTAQGVAILLYGIWTLAIGGALPAGSLIGQTGTVLIPLAEKIGPAIHVVGAIYIILGMGMGAVHRMLGLTNMVRERIPKALGKNETARLALGLLPVVAVFALAEWSLFTGRESFTRPLGFLGVIVVPLLGGIFPMLLLASARGKSEARPAVSTRLIGKPPAVVAVCALFMAGFFVHALWVWDDLLHAGVALGVGLVMIWVLAVIYEEGVFRKRIVLEVRVDSSTPGSAWFRLAAGDEPAESEVEAEYPEGEQALDPAGQRIDRMASLAGLEIRLPERHPREIKVWLHQVDPEGGSEGLPAKMKVRTSEDETSHDLSKTDGRLILPLAKGPLSLSLRFPTKSPLDLF